MANGWYSFQHQIEITTSNQWIDYGFFPLYAEVSVSIATGIYADMKAVITALDTAISATIDSSITEYGAVRLYRSSGLWKIFWKTGTHGSDNADNHIGHVLGYGDDADDGASYSMISDYQHQGAWYPEIVPTFDSGDRPKIFGGMPYRSWGGHIRRIAKTTSQHIREINFEKITKEKMLRKYNASSYGGYLNQDFETFWRQAARGTPFSIYIDTDLIMSESAVGTYSLTEPIDDLTRGIMPRMGPELELYSVNLKMVKDES